MLDLFRHRGLSNVVYGVVIAGMILVFVIQFRPNAGQKAASLKQACVATIKGWCVDPKDHMASYSLLVPRDQAGNLQVARAQSMGLKKVAIDGLIERELLIGEADRVGLSVSDDEITSSIYDGFIRVSVPSDNPQLSNSLGIADGRIYAGFRDRKTKLFERKVYERSIRNLVGRSPTEFREEQGRELLAAKMRNVVRAPVRVSETEALESYLGERSSATLETITVKQSYVTRYAVPASQADIDAWLTDKSHQEAVESSAKQRGGDGLPKEGHLRHILIKIAGTASAEEKGKALFRISEAAARIKAGAAFADVAREVSEDTGSAARGGDVGDKTDGFVPPFKKAADALKPGETTPGAIETTFGFHLIERDDPAKAGEVEAAIKKDAAREIYIKTKALEVTKSIATKILADVQSGMAADVAIDRAISPFVKATALPPALSIVAEPAALVEDAGLDATTIMRSDGSVSRVRPNSAPHGASAIVMQAVNAANDAEKPSLQTSSSFNKGGDPISTLSGEAASKVTQFAFASKDGDVMPEVVRATDGFVVVRLKEHKSATKDEFEKDREVYVQTLLVAKQAEALALYTKRLREAAKDQIKIDDTYIKEKTDGGAPEPVSEEEEGM